MTPNVWFIHWRGVGERLAIGSSSTRVLVSPEVTISTNIEFKPLGGSTAWAAPDFAMTSSEVMKVVPFMRKLDWFNGCLYNQETAEAPQLYFAHMLKRGDAYSLAAEIRQGLNLTHAK